MHFIVDLNRLMPYLPLQTLTQAVLRTLVRPNRERDREKTKHLMHRIVDLNYLLTFLPSLMSSTQADPVFIRNLFSQKEKDKKATALNC